MKLGQDGRLKLFVPFEDPLLERLKVFIVLPHYPLNGCSPLTF